MLLFGTYFVLTTSFLGGIALVINFFLHIRSFDAIGITISSIIILSCIINSMGQVLFLSNIVQVGTDQLRDAPTRYSSKYIQAYFWFDSLCCALVISTHIPLHGIVYNPQWNVLFLDKTQTTLTFILIIISTILIFALFIIHKNYKHWFLSERILVNPCKLTSDIFLFAVRHKKPIRRSAFTFCEDYIPTRLDFAKQRYGGPFTTEQVEDVKSMLGIIELIFSLGFYFLLEGNAFLSIFHYNVFVISRDIDPINYFSIMFFYYGLSVHVFSLLLIPLFRCFFATRLSK